MVKPGGRKTPLLAHPWPKRQPGAVCLHICQPSRFVDTRAAIWHMLKSTPRQRGQGGSNMAETKIAFTSAGRKLAGTVRIPDAVKPGERRPAWIVMHGFGSNSSSSNVIEPCD